MGSLTNRLPTYYVQGTNERGDPDPHEYLIFGYVPSLTPSAVNPIIFKSSNNTGFEMNTAINAGMPIFAASSATRDLQGPLTKSSNHPSWSPK